MPVNSSRLRRWFARAAIVLALVVAGSYFYARMRVRQAIRQVPQRIGVDIQQSTQGFTLSQSEGGRTIFTVHASRAVQYKEGGRAQLRDVSIIVYGRKARRYDQIYGADFEYDPQTGHITAQGEVHIDLEGNVEGPLNPDQAIPQELKNPIHLKTSGLVFNQKTGVAKTDRRIEFRVPQANGSALGATYDSKGAMLTLHSDIVAHLTGASKAEIAANHGVIMKGPNRVVLREAWMQRSAGGITAHELTALLRDDNTVERVLASEVKAEGKGETTFVTQAPHADLRVSKKNELRTATLTGGVNWRASGRNHTQGSAGVAHMAFAGKNRLQKVAASQGVRLTQLPAPRSSPGQSIEVSSAAIDFYVTDGRLLDHAETLGPGQVTVSPASPEAARTVATAQKLVARFQQDRLVSVVGRPDARVIVSAPGQPDKVSTSARLDVAFNAAGTVASLVQLGEFHYAEILAGSSMKREAWAERAQYLPNSEMVGLTGGPRFVEAGMTMTAHAIQLNRRTGEAAAQGDVKTTYTDLKGQPGGALLATSDPIHVTAKEMSARQQSGTALYSGGARLWQGSSIVQAPIIEFDRDRRTLLAHRASNDSGSVSTVFIQQDKDGKVTPVNVTSARLTYVDAQRLARFEGGVNIRGANATVTADRAFVFLQARGQNERGEGNLSLSKLDRVVAEGHVVIQEPNRRATGEKLEYTSQDAKFVLSGGPPSIFDAERGKITGDSLTFFTHDDRVLVEGNTSPTVTHTRVPSR